MTRLIVAKFGGSTLGPDGSCISKIVERINEMRRDSKVIAVFSAPLTIHNGKKRSLTDVVLEQGRNAESGTRPSLDIVRETYKKILGLIKDSDNRDQCKKIIEENLEKSQKALNEAHTKKEFTDEIRSAALAFSGEILMSHMMKYILIDDKIQADTIEFDDWPIVTDHNIESSNFLAAESRNRLEPMAKKVKANEVVTMGGFIGRTEEGIITTYERGGTDRTAVDLGILFHKLYDTSIDFEKDSSVVSADPKIVSSNLSEVSQLSYNEARLAGMFGMKILDPVAIKEAVENGVELPLIITNLNNPQKTTTIKRTLETTDGDPIKMVTGKSNCAIFRIETLLVQKLLVSLEKDRRYSEFVMLSPFTRDGTEFTRILFLDADYVRRNEKYFLAFDSLATITYNRGVITLIGDEMWRVQQVASRTSASVGESGLNILNMDAQEETSRIIIVIEDTNDNVAMAIKSIHGEIKNINAAH